MSDALAGLRVCDLSGQLAGAGATRWMAAFGAEVIRVEDPVRQGQWDIMRGAPPYKDDRRGIERGAAFNNHNVEKLGVTINLRTVAGRELLADLIATSDVVTENFSAGVMERLGFGYDRLRELRSDIIYVSNCGFGHTGPYREFRSWGPIAQAVSGLTHSTGLAGAEPAGWGFSYLDHTGASYMVMAVMMALWHRRRTGEGQWVDLAVVEAGANLHGADLLDWTVNANPTRGPGRPDSNRSRSPLMVPHGVYACGGDDAWVAIACRHDDDWAALVEALGADAERLELDHPDLVTVERRAAFEDDIDRRLGLWCRDRSRWEIEALLREAGVPAAAVATPPERIDGDIATAGRDLWPVVDHPEMGAIRVDGLPVELSATPWSIDYPAPTLGQHNHYVFGTLLGRSDAELDELAAAGVL